MLPSLNSNKMGTLKEQIEEEIKFLWAIRQICFNKRILKKIQFREKILKNKLKECSLK